MKKKIKKIELFSNDRLISVKYFNKNGQNTIDLKYEYSKEKKLVRLSKNVYDKNMNLILHAYTNPLEETLIFPKILFINILEKLYSKFLKYEMTVKIYKNKYIENKLVIKEVFISRNKETYKNREETFEYHENGNLKRKISYSADKTDILETIIYDKDGEMIEHDFCGHGNEHYKYCYSTIHLDNGNKEVITYQFKLHLSAESTSTKSIYNKKGKLIETDEDLFYYDNNDYVKCHIYFSRDSCMPDRETKYYFEIDKYGNWISEKGIYRTFQNIDGTNYYDEERESILKRKIVYY